MRVFWPHLADLFLAVTKPSQFGFLGLGNKERHPGVRLLIRRNRAIEIELRVISDIEGIGESIRLWPVDIPQKRLYRL